MPPINPLRDNLRIEATPGPTTLVIFGASGDLTKRKLLPAVYHLARNQRLPPRFAVIGVGRTQMDDDVFPRSVQGQPARVRRRSSGDDEVASSLARRHLLRRRRAGRPGALRTASRPGSTEIDGADGVLYYLAIPPGVYETVIEQLGDAGLATAEAPAWRRVIIEKPFGTDLASARELNAVVHQHFDEEQVFRIDHYLGKETVQNLLVFRFAQRHVRAGLEPALHRPRADHRGRDRRRRAPRRVLRRRRRAARHGPEPHDAAPRARRDGAADRLHRRERPRPQDGRARCRCSRWSRTATATVTDVVRAQYRSGLGGRRAEVPGVPPGSRTSQPDSTTETFVALRLQLDSWRWAGVPFYIRTGKRLPKRTTEIAIQFRRPPLQIFKRVSPSSVAPNLLIVNVQPDEGISVRFEAKLPGTRMQLAPVMMNFRYGTRVRRSGAGGLRDAAARRDARRSDAVRAPRFRRGVVGADHAGPRGVAGGTRPASSRTTRPASWGPPEADALMSRDGRRWRTL